MIALIVLLHLQAWYQGEVGKEIQHVDVSMKLNDEYMNYWSKMWKWLEFEDILKLVLFVGSSCLKLVRC